MLRLTPGATSQLTHGFGVRLWPGPPDLKITGLVHRMGRNAAGAAALRRYFHRGRMLAELVALRRLMINQCGRMVHPVA